MFNPRTALSFAKVAKNVRSISVFRQDVKLHSFKKFDAIFPRPLLKLEMKISLQNRTYAKGKDKKKEKGLQLTHKNSEKNIYF